MGDLIVVESVAETGSLQPIAGRCGSKLRGKDRYCQKYPVAPNGRCDLHGGNTPYGIASPHWKTGDHSRYPSLPKRLTDAYKASLDDPDAFSLRSNLGIIDSRINELLSNLDNSASSVAIWIDIRKHWAAFLSANRANDLAKANLAVTKLNELINTGDANSDTWFEILQATKLRKELVDSDAKRLQIASQVLTSEQAAGLFLRVIVLIKEGVLKHISNTDEAQNFLVFMSESLASLVPRE